MLIDNSSTLPDGVDVTTEDGWDKYLQDDLSWAHGYAKELGDEEFRQQISILCEIDPKTCEPLLHPMPVVMVPFMPATTQEEEDEGKDLFYTTCRGVALLGQAIAAISIAEAWMATAKPEDLKSGEPRVRPKDDPNRTEALILLAEHRDFGTRMYTSAISREDGKRQFADWKLCEGAPAGGAMLGIVPPVSVYSDPRLNPEIKIVREILNSDKVRWSN